MTIDAFDARMRVGRAQHYCMRQTVKGEIVEIAAPAGNEAQILPALRLVADDGPDQGGTQPMIGTLLMLFFGLPSIMRSL